MDTAQIARNTIRGKFFITNYILPVSYAYFPNISQHPDFLRYPLEVLIYSLIFRIFSPSAIYIRILNAILFLVNGGLIYRLTLVALKFGTISLDHDKENIYRAIALLTAIISSVFFFFYFNMATRDNYEVITYSMVLVTLNIGITRKTSPFIYGIVCGLLYLSKPTYSLLIFFLTIYYLLGRKNFKDWVIGGCICVAGFLIIISPFIIRSYLLTGEPFFALQQKIDLIKGVVYSHDELYKSFQKPPSVVETIKNNSSAYFARWLRGVLATANKLFSFPRLFVWMGILLLLLKNKPLRSFVFCYLSFVFIHVIIITNYVVIPDIERIYVPVVGVLYVLGLVGFFQFLIPLANKTKKESAFTYRIAFSTALLVTVLLSFYFESNDTLVKNNLAPITDYPVSVKEKIKQVNPACIYSNTPYYSAWFLDVPTIYPPQSYKEIQQSGPKECKYYLFYGETNGRDKYFSKYAELIYKSGEYGLYKFKFSK